MADSCANCFYSRPGLGAGLQCHFEAPAAAGVNNWPTIPATEWCGKHWPKDSPPPTAIVGVPGPVGPEGPAGSDGSSGATGPAGPAGADGIPDEAPSDGKLYGRKDTAWSEVVSEEVIPEAPTEGGPYGRYGGSWQPVLSNTAPAIASGWLTFGSDQTGIILYGGGRIYKESGGGIAFQKPQGGQPFVIENYGGGGAQNIATEPWVMSVLPEAGGVGPTGPAGPQGEPGLSVLSGIGAPTEGHAPGTTYIDVETGDTWQFT